MNTSFFTNYTDTKFIDKLKQCIDLCQSFWFSVSFIKKPGLRLLANEDGIQLPFTYIGSGKMQYIEGSRKANGAHLFRIPMDKEAPEDLYFDFRLPE